MEGEDLVLRAKAGGAEQVHRLKMPSGAVVAEGLSPLLALPPLRVGMRWSVAVVDPLTLRPSEVQIQVLRREALRWDGKTVDTHVVEIRSAYLKARAWVSGDGEVLQERTLFGLTFIKERIPDAEGVKGE
jgi:hypothetical protein